MATITHPRRWRAQLAAVLVIAGLLLSTEAPAGALPMAHWRNADNAATWLIAAHQKDTGGASPGTYADIVLGLAASDGDRAEAVAALGRLRTLTPSWVQPAGSSANPAAMAKAILAARALQDDIHRFAGLDLEAMLRGSESGGRFGSVTTFGQSLGILALAGTGAGVPATATAWLVSQQCADGGFSPTTSCASADPDHTGVATQALVAAGRRTEANRAGDWLVSHQSAGDGGFGDGSNANSTALATQALRALDRTGPADRGAARVASLQKTSGDNAGAIAFRSDADGDLLFATTQGVLAFGAPRLDLVRFPDVVGEPCAPGVGVTVVVDLTLFDRSVRVGCSMAEAPSGSTALETAGFAVTYRSFSFGRAICTIDAQPSQTAGGPPCLAPDNLGFWGYWQAPRGGPWTASFSGPDDTRPAPGSVEGWRFDPDYNTNALRPRAATDWPTVSLSGPGAALTRTPTSFRASVRQAGAPVTVGTVQLFQDGRPIGDAASVGSDGIANIVVSFPDRATSAITARYVGSPVHNPRSAAELLTVVINVGPGYWLIASDGGVFALGAVGFHGSEGGTRLVKPIVGSAATPSGAGYWLVASDGGIFAHGDAPFLGSLGGTRLNKPIVGMVATPSGKGYWLAASDGGVFAFGDARFHGSTGALRLVSPVVGMIATSSGRGYVLAAADGGVFTFGDAGFAGSMGGVALVRPVVGIIAEPGRSGYVLVAADGGVFAFGGAPFRGSTGGTRLVAPIVAASAVAGGYRFAASDGGVFSFGLPFLGSVATVPLVKPIVAFTSH